MNIQKIFILIIKVILLLSVILIFSYVNTKKAHIKKIEQLEKNKIKEGNESTEKLSKTDKIVDKLVKKSKKMLLFQSKQDEADKALMTNSLDTIDRNDFIDYPDPQIKKEDIPLNIIEGFGEDDDKADKERDKKLKAQQKKLEKRKKSMKRQRCKYKGITLFRWIYWFLYTILYIFIWLGKAIYDLVDEKTKAKPRDFLSGLFSPFSWIFYVFKKIIKFIKWAFLKLKYVIFFIISTIGNILFVFAPNFVIEILAYLFSPLIVLWRSITSLSIFSPFGAVCWDN